MKKVLFISSLLTLHHFAIAGCPTIPSSDSNVGALVWAMDIRNNTAKDITISCDNGGGSGIITSGNHAVFGNTACSAPVTYYYPSGKNGISSANCTYTAGTQTGTLTLNFSSCTTFSATISNSDSSKTAAYSCPKTTVNQTSPSSSVKDSCKYYRDPSSATYYPTVEYDQTGYFEISETATYHLEWSNILANLTEGQTMANKLLNNFKQTGAYVESSAHATYITNPTTYKGTLTIDLTTITPPNTYPSCNGSTSSTNCAMQCSAVNATI